MPPRKKKSNADDDSDKLKFCSCCHKKVPRRTELRHRQGEIRPALHASLEAKRHASGLPEYPRPPKKHKTSGRQSSSSRNQNTTTALKSFDASALAMEPTNDPYSEPEEPTSSRNSLQNEEEELDLRQKTAEILAARWNRAPADSESSESESESESNSSSSSDSDDLEEDSQEYEAISVWDELRELIWADIRPKGPVLFLKKLSTHIRLIASDLSKEDMDYLRASRSRLTNICLAIQTRVTKLSGFEPRSLDCCINSCCCYQGPHSDSTSCSYCREPRYDSQGRPRKQFIYLPVIPRLQARYSNPTIAKLMRHRAEVHVHTPDKITDVMDSDIYQNLLGKRVEVDGKTLSHTYFSDPRHIAMGLSTDGFCPFRRRKKTAWPLILFDYNLPPEIRFHLEHILAVGVIPGPKKPIDIDSFLWPLVQEFLQLAVGVHTWDSLTDTFFTLCAFLILVFGDIPAVSLLMRMKGHNGICPCRFCSIHGVRIPGNAKSAYYVPLDRSRHPDVANSTGIKVYDASNLPMRSHTEFLSQARKVQTAKTITEEKELSQIYGIKGVPILSFLSSLSFPHSFPYDFMHLIWENVVKNLILLWTGEFKGLDEGKEEYVLEPTVWTAIGAACAASGSTIPSAYGPRPFDVSSNKVSWTADSRSFWCLFLAPVLLERRFKKPKYYTHFIELVRLMNICLQFEITREELSQLREGLIKWVKDYERFYYQHDPARLSTCTLTVHGILHIPDGIGGGGPPAIRSQRYPYEALNRFVLDQARLTQIRNVYGLEKELRLAPERAERGEAIPNYTTCLLYPPHQKSVTLTPGLTLKMISYLTLRLGLSPAEVRQMLPSTVEEWGCLRILPDGDRIRSAAHRQQSHDSRDCSFVRVEQLVDANTRYRNRAILLEPRTFYGQLKNLYTVQLIRLVPSYPASEPSLFILAAIKTCAISRIHPTLDIHYYEKEGPLEVMDVTSIQCLVGRVRDGDTWAIVDRSGSLSRAVYVNDDEETL
ncbi:hypothetical protein NLI96_g4778 [Meripilus lineatus]|uniref:Transposase family Tnp2 protein n=1 Tax=Meripilus lineatus TaxID=2056292 RepID=A0AAD5V4J0_9APHY|nr:hypothetical protein NLI96_g4778 [Physisporinus lineatus]